MTNDLEFLDRRRMVYLKWYLVGFAGFMILMLVRHFFRLKGLNEQPVGLAVLAGLILTLLLQAGMLILSALLVRKFRADESLKAALDNEMVRSLMTESWLAAYLGACAATVFFAVSWFFYPLCDPVTICLTTIAAGAGANRAYFYFRYQQA